MTETKPRIAKILVVEDESHLAIGIAYNLEAEGFAATVVGEGREALRRLDEESPPFDLVILDLMLPGMSGYAVCEALRSRGSDIPVLMLSARTLTEDRIRGFDAGADQYLQKPFDLDELLAMVRRLLARRRRTSDSPAPGDLFAFGRARIDFASHKVQVDEKDLKLTALELKLLRYFVQHQGRVISRAKLLDDVWGMPFGPTTRTVDNFILRLRKYFEEDPARPRHFLSVRGAGYRFVAEGEDSSEPAENDEAGDGDGAEESDGT